ncbi:conserved hypothetical protein [Pediculus humanus corporis]|uniref:non-specific serine/threonine protein kinase n=1 Tax=Pediculus humanus subsp. corporis TaxID=121224 RepID=E0VUQ1_PEDHC|nr:uncharacterized protein Phum_PHUM452880 [Pediculus humanus corporis]EEB17107.1 conserved hypothetical protein [Pediculus humanus corporis]
MASIPKKTYSRRKASNISFLESNKDNSDPFDKLLQSPLKQDVKFKPLSFWEANIEKKCKKQSKSSKSNVDIFYDSDELNFTKTNNSKISGNNIIEFYQETNKLSKNRMRNNENPVNKSFSFVTLRKKYSNSNKTDKSYFNKKPNYKLNNNSNKEKINNNNSSHFESFNNNNNNNKQNIVDKKNMIESFYVKNSLADATRDCSLIGKNIWQLSCNGLNNFDNYDTKYKFDNNICMLNNLEIPMFKCDGIINDKTFVVNEGKFQSICTDYSDFEETSTLICQNDDEKSSLSSDSGQGLEDFSQVLSLATMISDINISNSDFNEPEKNVNENYLGTERNTNNAPVTITVTSPCYSPFASSQFTSNCSFKNVTTRRNNFNKKNKWQMNKNDENADPNSLTVQNNKTSEIFINGDQTLLDSYYSVDKEIFLSPQLDKGDKRNKNFLDSTHLQWSSPAFESTRIFINNEDEGNVLKKPESSSEGGGDSSFFDKTLVSKSNLIVPNDSHQNFTLPTDEIVNNLTKRKSKICKSLSKTARGFQCKDASNTICSLSNTYVKRRATINHTIKFLTSDGFSETSSDFKKAYECQTNVTKIGEGVFGEVFMYNDDTVIKIIPIEGEQKVNGEPQKKFEEILSEVTIASNLRRGQDNQSFGFSKMLKCWLVIGKYPEFLINLWNDFDAQGEGSENDSPEMFTEDQLFIVLELENGGRSLEAFTFNSAEQSFSIFVQTAFSLAAAENAFEFEHRDLHWGNILISKTCEKSTTHVLNGVKYEIPTKGVKVSIIDFTLSRVVHEDCCVFNDLSLDPTLFQSHGDYQFEIYRMMQRELNDDWSLFKPKNNIYWLHYTLDKMIKMVKYKKKTTQVHKKYMKELKTLESVILDYDNCTDFCLSRTFFE